MSVPHNLENFKDDMTTRIIPRMKASKSPIKYEICSLKVSDSTHIRFIMEKKFDNVNLKCHCIINDVVRNKYTQEHLIPLAEKDVFEVVISYMKKIASLS